MDSNWYSIIPGFTVCITATCAAELTRLAYRITAISALVFTPRRYVMAGYSAFVCNEGLA